ncbi:MAG TPA: MFS transporter [Solirubrobacteraceae bacterium]|nr:MFS transporter [Solirubrobacteraceae bacterium]
MTQYLRVLRHKNFRYLFFGQTASTVGDRLVVVAIALFITRRTGSPTDLAVVLAAQSLPLIALLLFGGVWADRLPRHRIMVVTDAVRAVLHGTLAVLILSGEVAIWQLVVIEALFGAAQAFFQPAYTGLLPQTVPEDEIQDARALTETTFNVAFMVGPALATAVVLGIGAWEAFALDAATFVVSAALLLRIEPRARGDAVVPATLLEELRVGWREVRSRAWVWVTIAVFTGAVLCVFAPWYSLAPIISRDFYGGAGVFGVLESVGGLGAVMGALAGIRWRPEHPLRVGLVMVLVWPMMAAALALTAPLAIVIVLSLATGFAFSLTMIWWETALARHIPAHALSRVSAYDWMGSLALLPVGYAIAGPLASAVGPRVVLGVGSAIGFALLVVGLAPRETRELGDGALAKQVAGDVRVEARSKA